jgi:hypothetical protein
VQRLSLETRHLDGHPWPCGLFIGGRRPLAWAANNPACCDVRLRTLAPTQTKVQWYSERGSRLACRQLAHGVCSHTTLQYQMQPSLQRAITQPTPEQARTQRDATKEERKRPPHTRTSPAQKDSNTRARICAAQLRGCVSAPCRHPEALLTHDTRTLRSQSCSQPSNGPPPGIMPHYRTPHSRRAAQSSTPDAAGGSAAPRTAGTVAVLQECHAHTAKRRHRTAPLGGATRSASSVLHRGHAAARTRQQRARAARHNAQTNCVSLLLLLPITFITVACAADRRCLWVCWWLGGPGVSRGQPPPPPLLLSGRLASLRGPRPQPPSCWA